MRISDWSSDVCSSDLPASLSEPWSACATSSTAAQLPSASQVAVTARSISPRPVSLGAVPGRDIWPTDRESLVQGKGVSVRVELGGGSESKIKRLMNHRTKYLRRVKRLIYM